MSMDINDSKKHPSSDKPASPEADNRTYNYNSVDLQRLFAKIIESLSSPDESGRMIERILTTVCKHFRFGCGFVYEVDHTNAFLLKEHYAAYKAKNLPESFKLEDHLNEDEIQLMQQTSLFYQHHDDEAPENDPTRIFDSNTLMLAPVLNKDSVPIGLVGMMDRRRNILLDDDAVKAAKMVLNLLANHIKLNIYQRNLEFAQQSLMGILDNTGIDVYVNDFYTHEIRHIRFSA